jgi:hypothetical protein
LYAHDTVELRLTVCWEVFPIKHPRELGRQPHTEYYNLYGRLETNVAPLQYARDGTDELSRRSVLAAIIWEVSVGDDDSWSLQGKGEPRRIRVAQGY